MGIFKSLKGLSAWAKNVVTRWGKPGENKAAEAPVIPAAGPSTPPDKRGDGRVLLERHRANGKFSSHRIDNKQRINGVRVRDLRYQAGLR